MSIERVVDNFLCRHWQEVEQYASRLCEGGYPDRYGCGWYHGAWILLRCLGLVSNPYWHEKFYVSSVRAKLPNDIAIVGTAGISMPYVAWNACKCRMTIYDICTTPLTLAAKFAHEQEIDWSVKEMDILHLPQNPDQFDVVVNDAFLTRFECQERLIVINNIRSILRDGGSYITTVRIGVGKSGYRSNETRRENFVRKAIEKAKEKNIMDVERIEVAARTYIENMLSYQMLEKTELVNLFEQSGMRVSFIEEAKVMGESEESTYLRVIANKA